MAVNSRKAVVANHLGTLLAFVSLAWTEKCASDNSQWRLRLWAMGLKPPPNLVKAPPPILLSRFVNEHHKHYSEMRSITTIKL